MVKLSNVKIVDLSDNNVSNEAFFDDVVTFVLSFAVDGTSGDDESVSEESPSLGLSAPVPSTPPSEAHHDGKQFEQVALIISQADGAEWDDQSADVHRSPERNSDGWRRSFNHPMIPQPCECGLSDETNGKNRRSMDNHVFCISLKPQKMRHIK